MGRLYSSLKIFQYPEKIRSLAPARSAAAPVHIRLKPTNRCNHNCFYCAYRHPDQQLGQDMRLADSIAYEKMMEIARDLVTIGVQAVTYSGGGEPLLYPHLLEASRIMVEGGVKLACLSNGSLLDGAIAEFFSQNAVWLRVSMDGWDDESYQRVRGVKYGEFSRIINNLENFARLGGPCLLGVSYIIHAGNWSRIPEMFQRLKNIGVKSVKASAAIISNEAAETTAYHAPYFQRTWELIQRVKDELEDENFEIFDAWHTVDDKFDKDYHWCPYSQITPVIGADSCVYPCKDKAYNNAAILGDLKDLSFRDFWFSFKSNFYRLDPSRDCLHHCGANNVNQMLLDFIDLDERHGSFV